MFALVFVVLWEQRDLSSGKDLKGIHGQPVPEIKYCILSSRNYNYHDGHIEFDKCQSRLLHVGGNPRAGAVPHLDWDSFLHYLPGGPCR